MGLRWGVTAAVAFAALAGTAKPAAAQPRPGELYAGLGFGNAVCDNDKPDSDCPVDGAFTMVLGGGWRFRDQLSWGGELGIWAFKIRDEWRGGLDDSATDVKFSSVYLATHLRWYWFDRTVGAQPYLQGGLGVGSAKAEASNDTGTYEYTAGGFVIPAAIGVDWSIGKRFRLGGQAQAYLHISNEICEDTPTANKDCRSPGKNEDGEREGVLLPWRIVLLGTYTL